MNKYVRKFVQWLHHWEPLFILFNGKLMYTENINEQEFIHIKQNKSERL
jgi:hypothetical protein